MPIKEIDLSALAARGNMTLNVTPAEDPLERDSRLSRQVEDDALRRYKEKSVFTLFCAAFTATFGAALWSALNSAPEQAKWGQTIVASVLTGAVGYLVGKNK